MLQAQRSIMSQEISHLQDNPSLHHLYSFLQLPSENQQDQHLSSDHIPQLLQQLLLVQQQQVSDRQASRHEIQPLANYIASRASPNEISEPQYAPDTVVGRNGLRALGSNDNNILLSLAAQLHSHRPDSATVSTAGYPLYNVTHYPRNPAESVSNVIAQHYPMTPSLLPTTLPTSNTIDNLRIKNTVQNRNLPPMQPENEDSTLYRSIVSALQSIRPW
jgi:hypothetical protein